MSICKATYLGNNVFRFTDVEDNDYVDMTLPDWRTNINLTQITRSGALVDLTVVDGHELKLDVLDAGTNLN